MINVADDIVMVNDRCGGWYSNGEW